MFPHDGVLGHRLQKFLASRDIDDAYEIGGILGKGAYSVVKSAKAKKTNDEVRSIAAMLVMAMTNEWF